VKFIKIHEQILEALTDDSNTKGVYYEHENTSKFFPALFLKSTVVEIDKGDNKVMPIVRRISEAFFRKASLFYKVLHLETLGNYRLGILHVK